MSNTIKPSTIAKGPFAKPLTGKALRHDIRAAQRLQFAPLVRQIQQEKAQSRAAQKRVAALFPQYTHAVAKAGRQTRAAYGDANASIRNTSLQTADYAEALRSKLAQENMSDAALRGATYDPSSAYTAANANLARVNSAAVLQDVNSVQKANSRNYYADKKRIGVREGIQQQMAEMARRRGLNSDLRDVARDKGALATDLRAKARDSERDFYLGLLSAQNSSQYRKFAMKQQANSAKEDRKQARRQRRLAKLNDRNERADDHRAAQYQQNQDQGGNRDSGLPGAHKDRRRATAYLRQAPKGAYHSPKEAIDYLINRGISPGVARYIVHHMKHAGGSNSELDNQGHGHGG